MHVQLLFISLWWSYIITHDYITIIIIHMIIYTFDCTWSYTPIRKEREGELSRILLCIAVTPGPFKVACHVPCSLPSADILQAPRLALKTFHSLWLAGLVSFTIAQSSTELLFSFLSFFLLACKALPSFSNCVLFFFFAMVKQHQKMEESK